MNPNPRRLAEEGSTSGPMIPAEPFDKFERFELEVMVELMREPIRSIDQCISKGKLKTLCRQLLARNIALQARIVQLETKAEGDK